MKIKPESEISSHITLTSVLSGLLHSGYVSSLKLVVKHSRSSPHSQLIF